MRGYIDDGSISGLFEGRGKSKVECPVPSVKESESLRRGALGGTVNQLELILFEIAINNDKEIFVKDQRTVQWPDKPEMF
jgi:hypothetical protein